MVVWVPDWPVVAAAAHHGHDPQRPLAVVEHGEIYACSAAARVEGVRRGMRRRDAAARCPELIVLDRAAEHEIRTFEIVLSAVEEIAAGVMPIRPGLCALRVASRFYGGEAQAAGTVAEHLVAAGLWDCRIGIADGIFAAEQAARRVAPQDCRIIDAGGSAAFLAGLPVTVLDDPDLATLLRRLGIRSLGDFAVLDPRDVLTRFGTHGAGLHRLARGQDTRPTAARRPPLELGQRITFEPGLETIEPIVFSTRQTADRLVAELARHGLVCTQVQIEVATEGGWIGARVWAHSRWFTSSDLIDRLYWQLQGDPAPHPVTAVRLVPESVRVIGRPRRGFVGRHPGRSGRAGGRSATGDARPGRGARTCPAGWAESTGPATAEPVGGAPDRPTRPAAALAGEHSAARAGPGVFRAATRPDAGRGPASGGRRRTWPAQRAAGDDRGRRCRPDANRGLGWAVADRRAAGGTRPGLVRWPGSRWSGWMAAPG